MTSALAQRVCGTRVFRAEDDARDVTFLVSDLHVPMAGGEVLERLQSLLAAAMQQAARCRVLVLGDLFSGIVNERQLALGAWRELVAALRAAVTAGVSVSVLHGNRDFMLGRTFARETGCRVVPGGLHVALDGRPALVLHGDELCTNDVPYQKSKRWLRSWWARAICAGMPLGVAAAVGRRARQRSGQVMATGDPSRFVPVADAVAAVFAAGFDDLVFGHVHTPSVGAFRHAGAAGRYHVLPAFDELAAFLVHERGRGFRFRMLDEAEPPPRFPELRFAEASWLWPASGGPLSSRAPLSSRTPPSSLTMAENVPADAPRDVVAIDGPSGAGKSTVARRLAERLGYSYLDTGAMYRAVTWCFLEHEHNDLNDRARTRALLEDLTLEVKPGGVVLLDGRDVGTHLRSREVESRVSAVSAVPEVRSAMRELQREVARRGPVVAEGRDMASVVFPHARWKFYIDAEPEVRGRRRFLELSGKRQVSEADVLDELAVRDRLDSTRRDAPLARSADAHYIDTTGLAIEQVVDAILAVMGRSGT